MSDNGFPGGRHSCEGWNPVTSERTTLCPRLRGDDGNLATMP